ncbi:uncharacterized protein EI90DRAFT_3119240 [Cantharellus anzutake]|uniref:uncharacterized protein n=1 Tax=Cantharellus anzutake TaxID=1750568 RepID=UPI001907A168|nr:uncharacterized protein EI90DRAFT_3119240 [Cantharellus anzutake]KAF8336926.1 hypothetical protein EI90DRAFT_3119240 [Cantharellus anzutake]
MLKLDTGNAAVTGIGTRRTRNVHNVSGPGFLGNKPYKAAVDVAGIPPNIINYASHETPPVGAGNQRGHYDQGQGSEPSSVHALPLSTGMSCGIHLAKGYFPGIFDEQQFMRRSMFSRDLNSDEYFSLMLYRVFRFSASKSAAESGKLQREAMRAYSEELEEPSIATIMATLLLSSLLSKPKPQLAEDLLRSLFNFISMCYTADYIVGLDSHRERNLLQNVSLNKISKLLEKVHAIAEEVGFRLRGHCDHGDDQLSLTTSQARGKGEESVITHTPPQRGANINIVPSEQFADLPRITGRSIDDSPEGDGHQANSSTPVLLGSHPPQDVHLIIETLRPFLRHYGYELVHG